MGKQCWMCDVLHGHHHRGRTFSVVNYYRNEATQGRLCLFTDSTFVPTTQIKRKVEMCRVSKEIRLNLQVRARLRFSTGNERKEIQRAVVSWYGFLPGCSIHHPVSLSGAARRNLFSEQLTRGSCLSLEYSNKQLSLTG